MDLSTVFCLEIPLIYVMERNMLINIIKIKAKNNLKESKICFDICEAKVFEFFDRFCDDEFCDKF
jgi:hypothetical protein